MTFTIDKLAKTLQTIFTTEADTAAKELRLLTDLHRRLDANHGVTGSWLRFPVLSVRSWQTPWD